MTSISFDIDYWKYLSFNGPINLFNFKRLFVSFFCLRDSMCKSFFWTKKERFYPSKIHAWLFVLYNTYSTRFYCLQAKKTSIRRILIGKTHRHWCLLIKWTCSPSNTPAVNQRRSLKFMDVDRHMLQLVMSVLIISGNEISSKKLLSQPLLFRWIEISIIFHCMSKAQDECNRLLDEYMYVCAYMYRKVIIFHVICTNNSWAREKKEKKLDYLFMIDVNAKKKEISPEKQRRRERKSPNNNGNSRWLSTRIGVLL